MPVAATVLPMNSSPVPPRIDVDATKIGGTRDTVSAEIAEAIKAMGGDETATLDEPEGEPAAAADGDEPAKAEGAEPKERGPDGKFLPKGEKAAKVDAKAEPAAVEPAAEEKAKAEAAAADKAAATVKETRRAEQFAKAAREDRARVAEHGALKAKLAAAEARAAEAEKFMAHKGNPAELLKAAGHTIDDVLRQTIEGAPEKILTADEKTAALVEARVQAILDARDKAAAEKAETEKAAQAKAADEAREKWIADTRSGVKRIVDSDPEKYETIAKLGAHDRVLFLIENVYRHGIDEDGHKYAPGTALPLDKATEIMENWLSEKFFADVKSLSKVAKRFAPQEQIAAAATEARPKPGTQVRPTAPTAISNRRAAPIAAPSEDRDELSDEEALALATSKLAYR